MSPITNYRLLSRVDLRPAYTSLGLPESAFRPATTARPKRLFDCVLNADAAKPDSLWLFKGADYFTYDLMGNDIRRGPEPIAGNWGGDTLPHLFRTGISGAVWGGPTFHKLWYLFKDEMFVRLDSTQSWQVTAGPRGVLGAWASGALSLIHI